MENGITAGVGGGRFDPNGTCTRAQIAAFLYRYMKWRKNSPGSFHREPGLFCVSRCYSRKTGTYFVPLESMMATRPQKAANEPF